MPTKKVKNATPKLRFPEFRDGDGWSEKPLGEIAEIKLGKMLDQKKHTTGHLLPYLNNVAVRWNEVDTSNLPKMYFDDNELDRFGLQKGDVVVCEGGEPGRSAIWDGRLPELKFQKAIHRVRFKVPFEASLLVSYLEAVSGTTKFESLFTGGGIKHLTRQTFEKLNFPLPPTPAEQRKIAACLGSLDDWIAAEARRLAALRRHKTGLMQQLFPRPGQTRPHLRFPEFQNAGAWEPMPIDKLAGIKSGGTPSKSNPDYWNGEVPWVSAKDMKVLRLDDSEDHVTQLAVDDGAKLVPAGTLLMLFRGMTLLKDVPICLLQRPMTFNQDVKALTPRKAVAGDFLAYLLIANKPSLRTLVDIAGHGTGRLNTDEVKRLELATPKEPAEQRRIADCLAAFDARLSAQSAKLAALRHHKRGLMQQLFPSPQ